MEATLWLLGWALVPAQPTLPPLPTLPAAYAPAPGGVAGVGLTSPPSVRSGEWLLAPRLARAQELVYRGTFTEQAGGPRVHFHRSYRIDLRCFVLDTPPRGAEVALLTTLRSNEPLSEGSREAPARSVRLERLHVDLQGKAGAEPGVSLEVPLDGAPTLEAGFFLEVPNGKARVGQSWDENVADLPPRRWTVTGSETVNSNPCLVVTGLQQSDDWERPRADRGGWRRVDRVWLSSRTGLAVRVERVIEQREPARVEPSQRSILRYDAEPTLFYPGQLADAPRQEIQQVLQFRASAAPWLASPSHFEKQLEALSRKIDYHLETQPPTPYRPALLTLKAQVAAARRGEAVAVEPPPPSPVTPARPPSVATVGQLAPDFVATDLTAPGSGQLGRWKGRPVLLVFYHPESDRAADVLTFCRNLNATYGRYMSVVGLSVVADVKQVRQQRDRLKCTFPVLDGGGLRFSYGVETTPKFVLIDAVGIVRGDYLGWGHETADEILTELRNWLPR
jgi:hypothetical protein